MDLIIINNQLRPSFTVNFAFEFLVKKQFKNLLHLIKANNLNSNVQKEKKGKKTFKEHT